MLRQRAIDKLTLLDAAVSLQQLYIPPGNRLEALHGKRAGQHSIRINDRCRICFRWSDAGAIDVEIIDFYGSGHNELLIGEALRGRKREDALISVKFGGLRDPTGGWVAIDARPAAVKNFLAYTLPIGRASPGRRARLRTGAAWRARAAAARSCGSERFRPRRGRAWAEP